MARRRSRRWRPPRELKPFFGRRPLPAGVAILLILLVIARLLQHHVQQAPFDFEAEKPYFVERVVDGDTFVLLGGERVRLIGVDTPETVHPNRPVEPLGPEASEFTRKHVEGQWVTLRFDRERRDRFGRILAYVYVDDWFLNEELIRAGYSRAETRYPFSQSMKRRFLRAEEEAREANRGIWGLEAERADLGTATSQTADAEWGPPCPFPTSSVRVLSDPSGLRKTISAS